MSHQTPPSGVLHENVGFGLGWTLEPVARLFDNAGSINGRFKCGRRILRVIIQERLHPLKPLTKVKDIGQVFLDVACS